MLYRENGQFKTSYAEDQQILDELERDLVRAVGQCVFGIRVDFHEQAVHPGGHGGAGEDGCEFTLPS